MWMKGSLDLFLQSLCLGWRFWSSTAGTGVFPVQAPRNREDLTSRSPGMSAKSDVFNVSSSASRRMAVAAIARSISRPHLLAEPRFGQTIDQKRGIRRDHTRPRKVVPCPPLRRAFRIAVISRSTWATLLLGTSGANSSRIPSILVRSRSLSRPILS
jgi:hypothetical protein